MKKISEKTNSGIDMNKVQSFEDFALKFKDHMWNTFFTLDKEGNVRQNMKYLSTADKCITAFKQSK